MFRTVFLLLVGGGFGVWMRRLPRSKGIWAAVELALDERKPMGDPLASRQVVGKLLVDLPTV